MYTEVLQGTGPLKMWNVYCDHPRCDGRRVASRNYERDAIKSARQHDADHDRKDARS